LIGFSLGARVIFYALLELAKTKAFGIVQDVFILGATLTASQNTWCSARSVVSGRFVNAYAKNDWVLNYLFRATSAGLSSVAGLRPIEGVPGLENVDVTDKIAGHMSYRTFMPLILDQLGFPVTADYFDEPVEPDFEGDRVVIREEEEEQTRKKGWFSKRTTKKTPQPPSGAAPSRPPSSSAVSFGSSRPKGSSHKPQEDKELPPRTDDATPTRLPSLSPSPAAVIDTSDGGVGGHATPEQRSSKPDVPVHAGFDLAAIKRMIGDAEHHPEQLVVPQPQWHHPDQGGSGVVPPPTLPPNLSSSPPLSPPISRIDNRMTMTGTVKEQDPYDDLTRSSDTLNATFTNMTMNDKDRMVGTTGVEQRRGSNVVVGVERLNSALSRPGNSTEISPVWSHPKTFKLGNASDATLGNPFAGSTGDQDRGTHYLAPSAYSHDTTGAGNGESTRFASSPGLSFGSPDGTITLESDPWNTAAEFRNTMGSSLGMNPWSM